MQNVRRMYAQNSAFINWDQFHIGSSCIPMENSSSMIHIETAADIHIRELLA